MRVKKKEPQSATKTELAKVINAGLFARGLGQIEAAQILRVPQPKISALANYKLSGFSVEKLMQLVTRLDNDVEILVRPGQAKGRIHVSAA
jgi:predicted XRE-type DNA-binding protein